MWAVWKTNLGTFYFFPSFLSLLSPSFSLSLYWLPLWKSEPLKKIIMSSWQRRTQRDGRDSKGQNICIHHINKRLYNPQKLIFALQQTICRQQQVCIWEIKSGLQFSTLFSLFFLDQCLLKGHSRPTEAMNPVGKCLAWFTHSPLSLHTMNPWERHIQRAGARSREAPILSHGVATRSLSVMVTQTGSFTHDLLFPPAGESPSSNSEICFSHDLNLWVLLGAFLADTKAFCTVVFLAWTNAIS